MTTLLPVALQEAAGQRRREVNTWYILAALAARTHKLADAETFFRQCLRSPAPENEARIYSGLLSVLFRQKKYKDAAALCREALASRSVRNTRPWLFEANLAGALSALGEFEEALAHADTAIKLSEEETKLVSRKSKAEILAAAGRFAEAVRECEDTIQEFPQVVRAQEVRYTLSNVYSLKGDHAKSEEQLRLILETDPDAPLANNNLGYQMADRNVNLDEAERLIRHAIDAQRTARKDADEEGGENASYLDSLGWVLFRKGKLAEAREWLEKATTLADGADNGEVWDHLGDVYARLDLPAKAKEAWQTAARLYKDDRRKTSAAKGAEVEKKLKTVEG